MKVLIGGLAATAILLVVLIGAYIWAGNQPAPTSNPSPTPTQIAAASTPPAATTPGQTKTAPAQTPTPTTASPTPSETATSAPTGSSPSPTTNPDILAQVNEVMTQVPPIRELDPLRDTPLKIQSRQEFHDFLQEAIKDQTDPDLLAAQQRLLQRLGLLPDDADLEQMLIDLQSGAAAAYYRFDDQTMYVIDDGTPFDAAERWYVSHEYTHALDDQHFQIGDNQITDPSQGDAALANLGVIEGDATTTMYLWAQQHLSLQELLEISLLSISGDDAQLLASMPPYLVRQLSFPYQEGYTFVSGLQTSSGWSAVNDALQHPPPSTEQILHPEKYTAHEAPIDVQLKDPTADLGGGGWKQTYIDTFGELNMQMFVAGGEEPESPIPGLPIGEWPHAAVAAGWGGDRIAMWERDESGSWAIAWSTAWDTKADADEFVARAGELQSTLDGTSKVVRTADTEVLLLMASSQQSLNELEGALTN
jgi:hypothetical protein